jgi:hypothetical protein
MGGTSGTSYLEPKSDFLRRGPMSAQHKLKVTKAEQAARATRPRPSAVRPTAKHSPGRPSKLTSRQWAEIGRRLATGESTSALAREFKIGKARISERFQVKTKELKALASQIVDVDTALEQLPVSEQGTVLSLVDQMRATTTNLATAARHGSATSARLAQIANHKAVQLDPTAPDPDDLRMVSALIQTSNQAATIGTAMLTVTKNDPKPAVAPEEEQDLSSLSDEELRVLECILGKAEGKVEDSEVMKRLEKLLATMKKGLDHAHCCEPVGPPDPLPAASPVPMPTAGVVDEEEDDGQAGIYRAPIEDFSSSGRARAMCRKN